MPNTTVSVFVSEEMVNKLFAAYSGLPIGRRNEIDERVKTGKVSLQQATLENLLYPKIADYAEKAEETWNAQLAAAREIAKFRGWTNEQLAKAVAEAK